MNRIRFHPEARLEYLESVTRYEVQLVGLGERFIDAVTDSLRRIQSNPLIYRKVNAECRQSRVRRFPYGIIYRSGHGCAEIIAVMHLHRKPGYWETRM